MKKSRFEFDITDWLDFAQFVNRWSYKIVEIHAVMRGPGGGNTAITMTLNVPKTDSFVAVLAEWYSGGNMTVSEFIETHSLNAE